MFIWIWLDQNLKIYRIFVYEGFEDLKCKMLGLTFETFDKLTKIRHMILDTWQNLRYGCILTLSENRVFF